MGSSAVRSWSVVVVAVAIIGYQHPGLVAPAGMASRDVASAVLAEEGVCRPSSLVWESALSDVLSNERTLGTRFAAWAMATGVLACRGPTAMHVRAYGTPL